MTLETGTSLTLYLLVSIVDNFANSLDPDQAWQFGSISGPTNVGPDQSKLFDTDGTCIPEIFF